MIFTYTHLKSCFPRKQHIPHSPPEGKPSACREVALAREEAAAASQNSKFRQTRTGCTSGSGQKRELGQDLQSITMFYHCPL